MTPYGGESYGVAFVRRVAMRCRFSLTPTLSRWEGGICKGPRQGWGRICEGLRKRKWDYVKLPERGGLRGLWVVLMCVGASLFVCPTMGPRPPSGKMGRGSSHHAYRGSRWLWVGSMYVGASLVLPTMGPRSESGKTGCVSPLCGYRIGVREDGGGVGSGAAYR